MMIPRGESREVRWLFEEKYKGVASPGYVRDRERLARGEPIDYVIGWKPFLGCVIGLSRRPLIPRPETEYWVGRVLDRLAGKGSSPRCLDLFSGSGCIGIAALAALPGATVDFADIDEDCVQQIAENCARNNINSHRYRIVKSDIFSAIEGRYDCIFANPPYVAERTAAVRLMPSVSLFEPSGALYGGGDGMVFIRRFLSEASRHLMPGGIIAMEFDDIQEKTLRIYADRVAGLRARFYRDQFGAWRFLVAHR